MLQELPPPTSSVSLRSTAFSPAGSVRHGSECPPGIHSLPCHASRPQGEALCYCYSGFVSLTYAFVLSAIPNSSPHRMSFPAPVSGAFFVLFPASKNTISLCIRRDCRTSGFFATIASQSGTGTAPVEKKGSDRPCRTDTRSNRPKHLYMKN